MSTHSCGGNKVIGSCRRGVGWCREVQAGGLRPECLPGPLDWGKGNSSGCRTSICCVPVKGGLLGTDPTLESPSALSAWIANPSSLLAFASRRGTRLFPKMSFQGVAEDHWRAGTGGLGKECTSSQALGSRD